jgi:hypothetical protein
VAGRRGALKAKLDFPRRREYMGRVPAPPRPRRLACFAAATAPAAAHDDGPLVDLALTASASAPAVNDGNAATTACGSDSVTVDLGRPRRLEGFGVSLAGDAASARGTIEAGGRRVAATIPVGTPPAHHSLFARTVRLRAGAGAR